MSFNFSEQYVTGILKGMNESECILSVVIIITWVKASAQLVILLEWKISSPLICLRLL